MLKFIKTGVAIACVSASLSSLAQDVSEIVVTAKGEQSLINVLPTSHVFGQEDIEAAQVKDVPALLSRIAGVNVTDSGGRGSNTGVFIRGVSNSQIIVLIDGVRVGSATLGAAALNSYPVEAIERIEVVKGPLSGIYGADAVGGVIQLFTKKGGDGLGTATASFGSDSLTEYGFSFNGGNERNSFHISANREDTDGIDRTSITTGGEADDDGFEETAISFGGRVAFSDSTTTNLSVLYTDSTVEFDNLFGGDISPFTDTKTLSTALSLNSELSDIVTWNTTLGINKDEAATTSGFPSEFITNRDSIGTELVTALSGSTLLTFGADYYQEDIESNNDFPITDRDNTGVYAQLQSTLGQFGLVGSLRYDDNSAYGSNTNGSIALNYNFSDSVRAVASVGTAFVAPSFNFLYFPFFGNPDILPEESESYELSILGNHDALSWRVSAYKTDIENLFSFDPATFTAANIGEAEIQGVEFELGTRLAEWDIMASIDFLSAEDVGSGIELDDRAERSLAISAAREFDKLDLRFDLRGESDRFDRRGTELSSYALFDISAVYRLNDQFTISANLDNVFDKDYTVNLATGTERFNTEGRQAKLSLRYAF